MHTGPRRITIVPAPPHQEIPAPKPKVPIQTSSVPERPKSRVASKFLPTVSSQPSFKVPSRPPSVTESSRKELGDQKPQTRATQPSQKGRTKEVPLAPPRSRARTTSNARPPSRMDLPKATRPPSRADPTRPTRTGATTTIKAADKRKRPEPQPAPSKDFEKTDSAASVPLPPSPTLPPAATTDSLPSLNLETEVEFVPPVTTSPRKATAETKVVHALKMGLPPPSSPPHSPPPTVRDEDVLLRAPTPEPVGELGGSAVGSAREPVQVQSTVVQMVEQHDPAPTPVPAKGPTEPLPVLVHPIAEPPIPLRVRGKEGVKKVGDLVAHFEDTSRYKPARPPRMVEQTPISALVSTIRKGFEDMRPLPALEIVDEGDSADITPPPRSIGRLRAGDVRGLDIRSRSKLGERTVLTTVQLNS